jgi:hypothetical protein
MKIYFTVVRGLTIVFIGICSLPSAAAAYQTIGQTATLHSGTAALYTITYRFGFLDRAVYLPIATSRNLQFGTTSDNLGYTLLTKNSSPTDVGTMAGLVLSHASIKNGLYYVPAGTTADFTLAATLIVPSGQKAADYAVTVSALPFYLVTKDGQTLRSELNPHELKLYTTPKASVKVLDQKSNPNITVTGVTYSISSSNTK